MKRILLMIIIFVSIIVINNLARSIYSLSQKQEIVEKTRKDLQKQKQEYKQLQEELSRVSNERFVEEQARNKLFLIRPEEQIIIIPKELITATGSAKKKEVILKKPWQQWIDLFF